MATTTNFGWETPDDTDLVKDGAAAMRTLGNAIDTSFVDLKGGTTNQVLAKNSNTDLDFKWVADATGIPATIIDAKGDLIAGTAADTAGRLGVGANGTVLTADSAETTGLKWATPASGVTLNGCSLYRTGSQTISNNTQTKITFDQELYDTNSYHSTSSNTSRITMPAAGKYQLFFKVDWGSGSATGVRNIYISKNNSLIAYWYNSQPISGNNVTMVGEIIVNAALNDYYEIEAYQDSGTSRTIFGDAGQTIFECNYLGA